MLCVYLVTAGTISADTPALVPPWTHGALRAGGGYAAPPLAPPSFPHTLLPHQQIRHFSPSARFINFFSYFSFLFPLVLRTSVSGGLGSPCALLPLLACRQSPSRPRVETAKRGGESASFTRRGARRGAAGRRAAALTGAAGRAGPGAAARHG